MTRRRVVLDTGALDRADDGELHERIQGYATRGWTPTIPTVTLAQALGGPNDAKIDRVLGRFGTVDTDPRTARLAGALRASTRRENGRPTPSGIDAIVAAHAVDADRAVVLTTDPKDLERLLVDLPHVVVERA